MKILPYKLILAAIMLLLSLDVLIPEIQAQTLDEANQDSLSVKILSPVKSKRDSTIVFIPWLGASIRNPKGLGRLIYTKFLDLELRDFIKNHFEQEFSQMCIKQFFFVKFSFDANEKISSVAFSKHTDTILQRIFTQFLDFSAPDWVVPDIMIDTPIIWAFTVTISHCSSGGIKQAEDRFFEEALLFQFEPFVNTTTKSEEWISGKYFFPYGPTELSF
ncbi:MAG TPA: hypothetical protein DCM08_13045 [Microscillaceae bacterium]|nr:hypothetical protein [Microscillaceae bacterium]